MCMFVPSLCDNKNANINEMLAHFSPFLYNLVLFSCRCWLLLLSGSVLQEGILANRIQFVISQQRIEHTQNLQKTNDSFENFIHTQTEKETKKHQKKYKSKCTFLFIIMESRASSLE